MLNWTRTRHLYSEERLVVSTTVGTIQEGMAMVSDTEGGIMKIKPAAGATSGLSAKLVGIAMNPRRTGAVTKGSATVVTPAGGGTVLLPNTVLSNSNVGIFTSTGTQLTATTSSASSSNVQVSTDSTTGLTALTFDSTAYDLGGGAVLNVFYNYTMSPAAESALYGNTSPGFFSSDMLAKIGIIKVGIISTTNYDPQANWYTGTNANGVKVVATGLFTDTASSSAGFTATNVNIRNFPTVSNPFLELEVNL